MEEEEGDLFGKNPRKFVDPLYTKPPKRNFCGQSTDQLDYFVYGIFIDTTKSVGLHHLQYSLSYDLTKTLVQYQKRFLCPYRATYREIPTTFCIKKTNQNLGKQVEWR